MKTANNTYSKKLVSAAEQFLEGLNHLLWPAVCLCCGQGTASGDDKLCENCWAGLMSAAGDQYCRSCGTEISEYGISDGSCNRCSGLQYEFDSLARCGIYTDTLRTMILAFKNGRTELNTFLGKLAESALLGGGFSNEVDLFVPVPLHWRRRFRRGYNQSALIAGKLAKEKAKISTDLVRVRYTRRQPMMETFAARVRNVAGAFAVRRRNKFTGKKVCLVDDIKTSGATLNECAKVLKQAGAIQVYAVVLAVAGN